MLTAHDSQASSDGSSKDERTSIGGSGGFAVDAEFDPPRVTLALKGELDLVGAPSLAREIDTLPWSQLEELVLDLAELTFIDSTGLHVLIRASRCAATKGLRFSVVRAPEHPRKLFTIVGLTDRLNVQP